MTDDMARKLLNGINNYEWMWENDISHKVFDSFNQDEIVLPSEQFQLSLKGRIREIEISKLLEKSRMSRNCRFILYLLLILFL